MENNIKILLKTILLLLIVVGLGYKFTAYFKLEPSDDGNSFKSLPKNTLDILAIGSSHSQYSINPAVIHQEIGAYTYVLGSPCQPMAMSYMFLKQALETQKPKVVVLDVFTMLPAQAVCYADGMFYRAINEMTNKNKIEASMLVDNPKVRWDYLFDLRMNHDNWKTMEIPKPKTVTPSFNKQLGYVSEKPTEYIFHHLLKWETTEEVTLKQKDIDMLEKINTLCKENDIKLVLIKAPFDIDQQNHNALASVWKLADKLKIEYIDYTKIADDIGFTIGMHGDTWHCNIWGSELVSSHLSMYLKEKGYLTDLSKNMEWEQLLSDLRLTTSRELVIHQIDIYRLLELAQKYDYNLVVKYSGSYTSTISNYENDMLQKVGINHDFLNKKSVSHMAVIENKKELKAVNGPFKVIIDGNQFSIDYNEIEVNGSKYAQLGELSILFFDKNWDFLHKADIDYSRRFFWQNGCDGWSCQ